jgi:hypothetical protein
MLYLNRIVFTLRQITWNGFRPYFASLEAVRQLFLCWMRGQGARLWRVGEADFTPRMMDKPLDKGV